ncbi:chemotaxis signal transduction protein [Serpentinimonas raichei]|uniref:Chemotaxis signal transduction protein n=1 Tax=Serpentinimonas raichei TaxID=1458425 RepID=A0A060NJV6_9BURK|nr:chemotaxis protein CheW [Serpentinimonas raichei]BAO81520.1 chemotaxis signal transduction protein [Serpentinimonas raichei]
MNPSKRPSLQSFEAELARKLAESAQRPQQAGWLALAFQGVRALLPLSQAGEIFAPTPLQRLPHCQPWVVGVADMRGTMCLIFDWVRLLDCAPQAPTPFEQAGAYWVGFNPAMGVHAALCVDRLYGLRHENDLEFESAQGRYLSGISRLARDAQGEQWLELDLHALCASAVFQNLLMPGFSRSVPAVPAVPLLT